MFLNSFDGTQIYYKIKRGKGPLLVFLHGWANNWTTWKKAISFFQGKGYSTLALDLRGHGRSGKPEKKEQYSFECFAKDVRAIIKKERISSFVLIGHSMGGMVAIKYQDMFGKGAKALVICSSTYQNVLEHTKIKVLSPFVKHVIDFILHHKALLKLHFSHLRHLKETDLAKLKKPSDYRVFYRGLQTTSIMSLFACLEDMLDYNATAALQKIKIPVLIIHGKNDKILPAIGSVEMRNRIKGAEIEFMPAGKHFANHFVNISEHEAVQECILGFLTRHKLAPKPLS